ncbi:MAG: DNA photolyase [Chlamydiae bacterium]|nr:DNA photolyase [Chlamydiota bacterium]
MNIHQIYVEKDLLNHKKVAQIKNRFPSVELVVIDKYQEIFNRTKQNFRLQKQNPCLILAKKHGNFIHPIPDSFKIGHDLNYYFSPVLNCPFDCRYCFLQGLNRSSHYVLFVNDEDFKGSITKTIESNLDQSIGFFSGYDSDSLALNSLSNFAEDYLPFFETFQNIQCEVRTKSVHIQPLLNLKTIKNTLVAYTLNPEEIIERDEKKTPRLSNRLEAIEKLQKVGYKIGLRFDPMMAIENGLNIYSRFFDQVFDRVEAKGVHSVTIGTFRLPKGVYQNYSKLDPLDFRLALLEETKEQEYRYASRWLDPLFDLAIDKISKHIPQELIYPMQNK